MALGKIELVTPPRSNFISIIPHFKRSLKRREGDRFQANRNIATTTALAAAAVAYLDAKYHIRKDITALYRLKQMEKKTQQAGMPFATNNISKDIGSISN